MGNVLVLMIFIWSFLGTIASGIMMVVSAAENGQHFCYAAISFFLLGAFFLFIKDDVVF